MRFAWFTQSLVSDWNHGNAHFLRGVVRELQRRGHAVAVYEPRCGWSRLNLVREHGGLPEQEFAAAFPDLVSTRYDASLELERVAASADVVVVHEWSDPRLLRRLGVLRARRGDFRLLFHDTHHRLATRPAELEAYDLRHVDGVLAFGSSLRDLYLERGLAERAWTWHEAADTTVFRPVLGSERAGELVWIGNWGDGERSADLREFLLEPTQQVGVRGTVHGVRYPPDALEALACTRLRYRGWVANHRAPEVFARHAVTVHVPRRPYVDALPGIPTIRPFEALACGIPLVSAPWEDVEGLFEPGRDYLLARDGDEAASCIDRVLADAELARALAAHGLETIRSRHTCAHRVEELLEILAEVDVEELAA